eukprot:CAMPEP_0194485826 /NCGR_PEP_ID=MMETSP0253-20130528/6698_1 /TAXON_ID=2966 /ORGANISM="Noctiluca scintillans" /LENGTH=127 /DNA_ID=CAMNT_0039325845 /DNA_START=66 /DNA_END=449 /DNA_ORIENTATION=-
MAFLSCCCSAAPTSDHMDAVQKTIDPSVPASESTVKAPWAAGETFEALLAVDTSQIGLGIVRARAKGALKIRAVMPTGSAAQWNLDHPDKTIQENQYIVSINEVKDMEDMIEECSKAKRLALVIQKP